MVHICASTCTADVVCGMYVMCATVMWFILITVRHGIRCGVCLWCGVKYALVCCNVWCVVELSVVRGVVRCL